MGELKLSVAPLLLPGEMDCLALPELEVWLIFGVVGATENPPFDDPRVFAFSDGGNILVAFPPLARLSLVT